jgi:hypothetical protein
MRLEDDDTFSGGRFSGTDGQHKNPNHNGYKDREKLSIFFH